ncbi:hypothetical protein R1sor_020166 [Riccia sorocarpa]|uniref:Uncharacterized protein n=1 Tax=Riccia sorocarpa TaxID=122646 RepID=A0ABD3IG90_9MARC
MRPHDTLLETRPDAILLEMRSEDFLLEMRPEDTLLEMCPEDILLEMHPDDTQTEKYSPDLRNFFIFKFTLLDPSFNPKPVHDTTADCRFEAPRRGTETNNYFKMDIFELRDTVTFEKCWHEEEEEAWQNEVLSVKDDRRRWSRGWFRVREVLRDARAKLEVDGKTNNHLGEEMTWRKEQLNNDSTPEEVKALAQVEQRLKQHELYEARLWYTRSRERWLSEDSVPTRYFFAKT